MKGAFGKKELLAVVPLSWSTIDRLEQAGEFPSRFWITDRRCAWDQSEVEAGWINVRRQARRRSPEKSRQLTAACIAR